MAATITGVPNDKCESKGYIFTSVKDTGLEVYSGSSYGAATPIDSYAKVEQVLGELHANSDSTVRIFTSVNDGYGNATTKQYVAGVATTQATLAAIA